MHIFIDESGSFKHDYRKTTVPSAVGALIIPTQQIPNFEKLFGRLRHKLPKERGEVKGRLLSESEVGEVVAVLKRVGALFEITVVDSAMHTAEELANHRARQAEKFTEHLTASHHKTLVKEIYDLKRQLESMPLQLYLQSVVLNELIYNVLNLASTYFAFRLPAELAVYHWILDAKDRSKITPWENWWSSIIGPMFQSKSFRKPLMAVEGGDYSYHERLITSFPDYLRAHVAENENSQYLDIRPILTESFRFSSDHEAGLEAVDILTNAVRRSLVGNFRQEGWLPVRQLMIHREQCIHLVHLGQSSSELPPPRYAQVIQDFQPGGRRLLPVHD
jgi:hypothetical protein